MNNINTEQLPIAILRDSIVFPVKEQIIDIIRRPSIKAAQQSAGTTHELILTAQRDPAIDEPGIDDIYTVGIVARIKRIAHTFKANVEHTNGLRITVEVLYRAEIKSIAMQDDMYVGFAHRLDEIEPSDSKTAKALSRTLQKTYETYCTAKGSRPSSSVSQCIQSGNLGELVDAICNNIPLDVAKKYQLLTTLDQSMRCTMLMAAMVEELSIIELQKDIEEKVHDCIDTNQKEYYLREQLKVIGDQLGVNDDPVSEAEEFRAKLDKLTLGEDIRKELGKCIDRLAKYPSGSHDAMVERNYIETCLELPWNIYTTEKLNIGAAAKKLDHDHYGLDKVKERILEFIAVRALAPDIKGQIICLVGPPGVGKTSIARSVAEALGRKYVRISLGGVHDEADIRGHRRTYIGAMPGRIINAIKQVGVSNPLILFDEIDKLASDYRGDPTSALLEVLDPEQNATFHDHYIDLPFDLSQVMFITTANDRSRIPEPLLDRMELIELPSYTLEEKMCIAKKHLVRKQITRHGLTAKQFKLSDKGLNLLIDGYTREAGVRTLEREIASLCRKSAKLIASGEAESVSITDKNLPDMLGPVKFKPERVEKTMEVGTVNGLAWTSVGGTMLEIEVAVMDGTGKIELTGSLGEVMRESAKTAVSHVRFRAAEFGIDPDFYKNKDIHIHAPEGATPKDGPSAGITIATALISALTGIPARGDVAMTGEITLRGRVLAIGGLREKSMAAMVAGAKTVIMPDDNSSDIAELSEEVRRSVTFIPVKRLDDVIAHALTSVPMPAIIAPAAPANKNDYIPNAGGTYEAGKSRV